MGCADTGHFLPVEIKCAESCTNSIQVKMPRVTRPAEGGDVISVDISPMANRSVGIGKSVSGLMKELPATALSEGVLVRPYFRKALGSLAQYGLAGIPTILVDPCECDMPENYKYRWLFQTERNSLGRFLGSEETDFSGMEMREVIESCGDENRRIGLADLSQACVLENHSTIVVLDKLLSHPAKATMQDICRLTPAAWAIRPYVSKVLKMIN